MNGTRVRLLVQFVASLALLLTFSSMNAYTLFLTILGAGIMALAFFSYYRPGAVLGLVLVVTSVAFSMDIETLVEASMLTTSILGLMLPVTLLTLFALSSEIESRPLYRPKRPMLVAGAFALLCVLSVPLTTVLVGIVMPNVTAKFSVLTETAIVLLFVSVGVTLLTSGRVERGD